MARKPKAKKLPKKPKQSASLEVWRNWERKCKDIKSENKRRLSKWESDKKAKANIIRKYS